MERVELEPAADLYSRNAAKGPRTEEMTPEQGRSALENAQKEPVFRWPVSISDLMVDTGEWGSIRVFGVRPAESVRRMILYLHGGGWVYGSFATHEKLVRELAARTDSLVVFPEYARSPEAQYPVALEQCWSILSRIPDFSRKNGEDLPLVLAGDSVGGNLAICLSLLAQDRKGPDINFKKSV